MVRIENWLHKQLAFDKCRKGDALSLIEVFTTKDNQTGIKERVMDEKVLLLFKFIAVISTTRSYTIDITAFVNATKSYVEKKINADNKIIELDHKLTLVWLKLVMLVAGLIIILCFRVHENYAILKYFSLDWRDFNAIDLGWMSFGYMLILEKSAEHLKNQ